MTTRLFPLVALALTASLGACKARQDQSDVKVLGDTVDGKAYVFSITSPVTAAVDDLIVDLLICPTVVKLESWNDLQNSGVCEKKSTMKFGVFWKAMVGKLYELQFDPKIWTKEKVLNITRMNAIMTPEQAGTQADIIDARTFTRLAIGILAKDEAWIQGQMGYDPKDTRIQMYVAGGDGAVNKAFQQNREYRLLVKFLKQVQTHETTTADGLASWGTSLFTMTMANTDACKALKFSQMEEGDYIDLKQPQAATISIGGTIYPNCVVFGGAEKLTSQALFDRLKADDWVRTSFAIQFVEVDAPKCGGKLVTKKGMTGLDEDKVILSSEGVKYVLVDCPDAEKPGFVEELKKADATGTCVEGVAKQTATGPVFQVFKACP